jgi:hypothetical protein
MAMYLTVSGPPAIHLIQLGRRTHRKFINGIRVRGREGDECPHGFRGRTGRVVGYAGGSGYLVRFDDGVEEFTYAHWLEGVVREQGSLSAATEVWPDVT